jgi:hypothetical protein
MTRVRPGGGFGFARFLLRGWRASWSSRLSWPEWIVDPDAKLEIDTIVAKAFE